MSESRRLNLTIAVDHCDLCEDCCSKRWRSKEHIVVICLGHVTYPFILLQHRPGRSLVISCWQIRSHRFIDAQKASCSLSFYHLLVLERSEFISIRIDHSNRIFPRFRRPWTNFVRRQINGERFREIDRENGSGTRNDKWQCTDSLESFS